MSKKQNPLLDEAKELEKEYDSTVKKYMSAFEELNGYRDLCKNLVDDSIFLLESIKKAPIKYSLNLKNEIKKIRKSEEIYKANYIKQKNKQKELYVDAGVLAVGGGAIYSFRNYLKDHFKNKDNKVKAAFIMVIFFALFVVIYLVKKFFNYKGDKELVDHIDDLKKEIIVLNNLITINQLHTDELKKLYENTEKEYEYLNQFESFEFKNIDADSRERFKTLVNMIQFLIQKLNESIEDFDV